MAIVECSGCGDCYGSIDEMRIIGGRPYCYSCYKKRMCPPDPPVYNCPKCDGSGMTKDGEVCSKCEGKGWIYGR